MSKLAWRLSRVGASEHTHMALAAYCAGIMISARLDGQYEDNPVPNADAEPPRPVAYVQSEAATGWETYADTTKDGH